MRRTETRREDPVLSYNQQVVGSIPAAPTKIEDTEEGKERRSGRIPDNVRKGPSSDDGQEAGRLRRGPTTDGGATATTGGQMPAPRRGGDDVPGPAASRGTPPHAALALTVQ